MVPAAVERKHRRDLEQRCLAARGRCRYRRRGQHGAPGPGAPDLRQLRHRLPVPGQRNVLVQELPAVEVLARVDTLCLDKTGTITTGRIRLGEVQGPDGDQAPSEVLSALALLSTVGEANATADAIREGLSDLRGLGEQGLKDAREPGNTGSSADVESVPFSSRRKWSAVRDRSGTTWVLGAPEIVLAGHSESVLDRARQIAAQGVRVVALARSGSPWRSAPGEDDPRLPDHLEAAGIVILTEDIRPDAAETLAYFHQQGVDAKVISGDSPETVAASPARPGSPPLTAASSLPWTHVPCLLVQAAGTRRMRTWSAWRRG